MLDRWPDRWGLVIASRVEPPLPLARLRAAGELAEFGQRRAAFQRRGGRGLAARESGQPAEPERTRELLQRTDGWAAGLRLSLAARRRDGAARRDAQRRSVTCSTTSRPRSSTTCPRALRDFLLRCSVLPELTRRALRAGERRCAGRAAARRGRAPWPVRQRARRDEPLTLRLHDLFRDFLEDRLQREQPDELPGLLRRAAAHEPDLSRAVGYLARAGAWDEAARALAQRGPELLSAGGGPTLEQMLALFPAPSSSGSPTCTCCAACWPSAATTGTPCSTRRSARPTATRRAGRRARRGGGARLRLRPACTISGRKARGHHGAEASCARSSWTTRRAR